MNAKEYVKHLDQKKSYWEIDKGSVTRLNDTPVNADNVYIVFRCVSCEGDNGEHYHAIPYRALKVDSIDGDYLTCCPKEENDGFFENYLKKDQVPKELKKIFNSTQFKVYEIPKDEYPIPSEKIIKGGTGNFFRA